MSAKRLRIAVGASIASVAINSCALVLAAALGRASILTPLDAVCALVSLSLIVLLTRRIRAIEAASRRPDYSRIAALRQDTASPLADVITAAERQAELDFGRETGEAQCERAHLHWH